MLDISVTFLLCMRVEGEGQEVEGEGQVMKGEEHSIKEEGGRGGGIGA